VQSAVQRRESVLHLWSGQRGGDAAVFTAAEGFDWAFCVPLRSESCPGWAIYMTGQFAAEVGADLEQSILEAPDELQDDVKFAELVGTTIANLRQSLRLERRQAAMRRFFAPVVMEALAGRDTDQVLAPREADLSVMFCDLRGFSRRSEQDADQLLELLERVSASLGVMTGHILDTGGVIGDFHGDAAMGFWGWPLDQSDIALRAADAAARILRTNHPRSGSNRFHCGIGIATGRAVAGRIGTVDQVKVTAFGPVVNLASRLEGMTKAFGAEIMIDQTTATAIRSAAGPFRVRRLATVRPSGMHSAIEACELLTSPQDQSNTLTDRQIADYEAAVDSMIAGAWDQAHDQFAALPAWDRPSQYLLDTIKHYNRVPPQGWEGVMDVPKL
jgi:adenylate cyclase